MFCPKCGTQNQEANKYCRQCRENLQVISLAMKRSLPVVLASKIDTSLNENSERFRRDAFLNGAVGILSLVGVAFAVWSRSSLLFLIPITLMCFGLSGWSYLAYKHSLTIKDEIDDLSFYQQPKKNLADLILPHVRNYLNKRRGK